MLDRTNSTTTVTVTRTARCCCGSSSIRVAGEPVINGICHCTNCKRRTGSAFGWSTYFPKAAVHERRGPLSSYRVKGQTRQTRFFCSQCGTTLTWTVDTLPDLVGIAGGCFADPPEDQPPLGEPEATHADGQRCQWLTLPEDWPRR